MRCPDLLPSPFCVEAEPNNMSNAPVKGDHLNNRLMERYVTFTYANEAQLGHI